MYRLPLPVPADDLTPYAGTYAIAAPGVAKANYMAVLEGHLQADGGCLRRSLLIGQLYLRDRGGNDGLAPGTLEQ